MNYQSVYLKIILQWASPCVSIALKIAMFKIMIKQPIHQDFSYNTSKQKNVRGSMFKFMFKYIGTYTKYHRYLSNMESIHLPTIAPLPNEVKFIVKILPEERPLVPTV